VSACGFPAAEAQKAGSVDVASQVHYDTELDVLDEYISRIERSSIAANFQSCRNDSGSGSVFFESQVERTAVALRDSMSQLAEQMLTQVR
jgi:hypothetical protein